MEYTMSSIQYSMEYTMASIQYSTEYRMASLPYPLEWQIPSILYSAEYRMESILYSMEYRMTVCVCWHYVDSPSPNQLENSKSIWESVLCKYFSYEISAQSTNGWSDCHSFITVVSWDIGYQGPGSLLLQIIGVHLFVQCYEDELWSWFFFLSITQHKLKMPCSIIILSKIAKN